jgi:hypothetical protein
MNFKTLFKNATDTKDLFKTFEYWEKYDLFDDPTYEPPVVRKYEQRGGYGAKKYTNTVTQYKLFNAFLYQLEQEDKSQGIFDPEKFEMNFRHWQKIFVKEVIVTKETTIKKLCERIYNFNH